MPIEPGAAQKEQLWKRAAHRGLSRLHLAGRPARTAGRPVGPRPCPQSKTAPHPEGGSGSQSSAPAAIKRGKPADAPSSWRQAGWRRSGWGGVWGVRRRPAPPASLPEAAARKRRRARASRGAKRGSRLSMTDVNCSGALTRKNGSTAGWRSCTEDGKMRCLTKSTSMTSWRWTQRRRGPRDCRAPWSRATTTRRTSSESCWRSCEASGQNTCSAGQVPAARGTWTKAPRPHSDQEQRRLSCWKNLLPPWLQPPPPGREGLLGPPFSLSLSLGHR